jgi:hypothetical protein
MGEHTTTKHGRRAATVRAAVALGLALPTALGAWGAAVPRAARAQGAVPPAAARPFAVGESLTYRVRVGKFGDVGRGAMWVDGPVEVRGQSAYLLRFEFATRVGLVKVANRTESWIDPVTMATLRFHKHERQPLNSHDQRVELYPDQRRWEAADGTTGRSPCEHPLDELSYLYYLRTLPLPDDTTFTFAHHYDAARNPTVVRVLGRETVSTPAGEFRTVAVEMRVRDGRHYKGDGGGVLRINLSDDPRRLLVRMQSQMPVVGAAVLTLESVAHAPEHAIARAP